MSSQGIPNGVFGTLAGVGVAKVVCWMAVVYTWVIARMIQWRAFNRINPPLPEHVAAGGTVSACSRFFTFRHGRTDAGLPVVDDPICAAPLHALGLFVQALQETPWRRANAR